MTRVIGISGKSGSNKLFYAFRIMRELKARGQKTVWLNFADPLYNEFTELADRYLGGESIEKLIQAFGLEGVSTWNLFELLSQDLGPRREYGYSRRLEAVRRAMGELGTGIRRKQNPDHYIKLMESRFGDVDFAVSTDLRFPNEADWIRRGGGMNIRLELVDADDHFGGYKYEEGMLDPNETALDDYSLFDYHFIRDVFDGQAFGRELEAFFQLPEFRETIR